MRPQHKPTSLASLNHGPKLQNSKHGKQGHNTRDLKAQLNTLVASRNAIISNRPRVEQLSLTFIAKAKKALESGNENLAREVLNMRAQQEQAAEDMMMLVDAEKVDLKNLNDQLTRYGNQAGSYLSPRSHLVKLPKVIPKTAAMNFTYAPTMNDSKIVDQWQETFVTEAKDFGSFALYAESKLNEAIHLSNEEQGGDSNIIDPGLPAVCCDLLVKMSNTAFGFRFAPLLKLLSTQILRCIYENTNISVDDMNGKNVSLRFLFSKKPWFVRLKEVMEERDDLKSIVSLEAQGKNMKDILDNRNQGIKMMFKRETALARQIAFRAWRNYYIDQRARRRRFRRYQLNMWLRRWKNEHFGEGGGEEAAAKSTAAGGTPADRSWQKRFRASEKENLKLQEELNELKRRMELATHELAITYEIIQELQPDHDHTASNTQTAAEKKSSTMREGDQLSGGGGEGALDEGDGRRLNRMGSLLHVGKKLHDWKNKVKDRLSRHASTKSITNLTAFQRQDVVMLTSETQTDISGEIKPCVEKLKLDSSKKTNKGKKNVNDLVGKSDKKVPKLSIKQAIIAVADVLGKACVQHATDAMNGRESPSFCEITRDVMIRQFGIKSLALKNLKSLVATTKANDEKDFVLNIFNEMSGVEVKGDRLTDPNDSFFVDLLIKFMQKLCPEKNYKQLSVVLSSDTDRSWLRTTVLEAFHECYGYMRLKDPDGYKLLVKDVKGLKVVLHQGKEKEPRVPLDEVLRIAMKHSASEKKAMLTKASPFLAAMAAAKMKGLVSGFAFKACTLREKEMKASRALFRDWDEKLHKAFEAEEGEETEGEGGGEREEEDGRGGHSGIYGAFSFDEFSEMMCVGLRKEIDEADLMVLFNEWHDLILKEKTDLGFEGEEEGEGEVEVVSEENAHAKKLLTKEVTDCELEIEEEGEKLERQAKGGRCASQRRSSIAAMQSGSEQGGLSRPPKPLPKISKAKNRWKVAVKTVNANFFFGGFTKEDEREARVLEAGLGGLKFGESAFSQLLWNYRLFVETL